MKSFTDIIQFSVDYPYNSSRFPIISLEKSRQYEPTKDQVFLNFTLHGDYVGSTVEKSNYFVLLKNIAEAAIDHLTLDISTIKIDSRQEQLSDHEISDYEIHTTVLKSIPGIELYFGDYSTRAIVITGDLPNWTWEIIHQAIESVARYSLIDEDDHSLRNSWDVWEAWESWQCQGICGDLEQYGINVEEIFNSLDELDQQKYQDYCNWLWNILNDIDSIPAVETIDTLETNAYSYYDFELKDIEGNLTEVGTQLTDYLRSI